MRQPATNRSASCPPDTSHPAPHGTSATTPQAHASSDQDTADATEAKAQPEATKPEPNASSNSDQQHRSSCRGGEPTDGLIPVAVGLSYARRQGRASCRTVPTFHAHRAELSCGGARAAAHQAEQCVAHAGGSTRSPTRNASPSAAPNAGGCLSFLKDTRPSTALQHVTMRRDDELPGRTTTERRAPSGSGVKQRQG